MWEDFESGDSHFDSEEFERCHSALVGTLKNNGFAINVEFGGVWCGFCHATIIMYPLRPAWLLFLAMA